MKTNPETRVPSPASSYRQAGVDLDAGNETVRRIKALARQTFTPEVLSDIGSFGGLFRLDRDRYLDPVLVSSADETAFEVRALLEARGVLRPFTGRRGIHRFVTSGDGKTFARLGSRFLGPEVCEVESWQWT